MHPTVYHVAEDAGVSIATVSQVINNSPKVLPKTREKVLKVIEELDYHPNVSAQGLALNITEITVLIFPDISGPFYSEVIRGVENEACQHDYHLLIYSMHGKENNPLFLRRLPGRVDGLILMIRSVDDLNWVRVSGYQTHAKDYSGVCTNTLAKTVTQWITDPADSSREMGWVMTEDDTPYCRPVKRIAERCRKKNGQWAVCVIISTLSPQAVLHLVGGQNYEADDPKAVLLAYVNFYDLRGGSVDIEIKEDKQGQATTKRNKKRYEAQQVLLQLEVLAHNVAVWARGWLTPSCSKVARFGLNRLVREVFQINGKLIFDQSIDFLYTIHDQADPLASEWCKGLAPLFAPEQVAITLGEI